MKNLCCFMLKKLFCVIFSDTVLLNIGALEILRMVSIEAYCTSIGRFFGRLWHFGNTRSIFWIRYQDVFIILLCLFFIIVFSKCIICFFEIFVLVICCWILLNSVIFKHVHCSSQFLELNYRNLFFFQINKTIDW